MRRKLTWMKDLHVRFKSIKSSGILCAPQMEENLTSCNSMNGPGEYYAKWNKAVRERQAPYGLTYMWNLMKKIKRGIKQKQRRGHTEQTDSCQRRRGTGWKKVKWLARKHTYITHKHRQQCSRDRGAGGSGPGGGRQRREKGEWKETLLWVMGARCRVQIMFYWVVHLKPVWFCELISHQ